MNTLSADTGDKQLLAPLGHGPAGMGQGRYNFALGAAGIVSLSTAGGVTSGTWSGLGPVNTAWQIL